MKFSALSIVIVLILSSCSSLDYYIHKNPSAKNLKYIELKKHEKLLVIEQTNGFIWGGLYPGVVASNPNIVKTQKIRDGRTSYVYIEGENVGETTVYYTAIMSSDEPNESHEYKETKKEKEEREKYYPEAAPSKCHSRFKVKVIE